MLTDYHFFWRILFLRWIMIIGEMKIDWVPTVVWETCLHNLIYRQTCEIVIILSYSIFNTSTLINLGRAKPIEVVRRCMF